ncbi:MAG TPA: metal-sulfur cluster assembly factor [Candidatus Udaeobacter sp.]|nr:metal-sulfur cluster assembly factor [Candidatus Udaeobacter sp.]
MGRRARALACSWPAKRRDGRDVPGGVPHLPQDAPPRLVTQRLWEALAEVQDPEMPVNLVDLGVIYGISESDGVVDVDLTFTAMGCPASDFILDDVRERLLREPGVNEVRVNIVWDPPWTAARLTEAGRDALESWGLAV